ncbi:Uncharacterised protein [Mycobacteroides abscessus subsp. massiliense]|nr:Uncharacterised protein [Mycobacteroides abscessus subsp. massiliense]
MWGTVQRTCVAFQCGTDIGDPDGNLILFCGAEA